MVHKAVASSWKYICCCCCLVISHVWLFATPWTVAHQAPPSMGFPWQEYWSWWPFPPSWDLPAPKIEPVSPALAGGFFTTDPPGKPRNTWCGTRDQIANTHWIIEKAREFQKNIYFCFIDYAKAFDCLNHNKLREILQEMGIPHHLTCLLRNLYAGQEATVITGHGTTDWVQIGKGVRQGCILSPCLFNLYTEYMRNAGLGEAQTGIKIARRNINNLRYADDTTLMAESEEELKSLLMKVKEESE